MKTTTVTKLRHAEKLLKTAFAEIVEAIAADADYATRAMANDSTAALIVSAMVKTNNAGKSLEELLKQHD